MRGRSELVTVVVAALALVLLVFALLYPSSTCAAGINYRDPAGPHLGWHGYPRPNTNWIDRTGRDR